MRFTTVLFDLDHTLLDSDESERLAFADTMASVGIESDAALLATYQEINGALWKRVELGELSPNEVKHRRFELLVDALSADADPMQLAEHYVDALGSHGELYDGVIDMLDTMAAHAQLALITNGLSSVQRSRIERLGLGRYFTRVAISGELGIAKPDPAIFDYLLGEVGDPPRDTVIIVGDSLSSDMAGGVNAGIATCWFNPHGHTSETFTPTTSVRAVQDLPDALRSFSL